MTDYSATKRSSSSSRGNHTFPNTVWAEMNFSSFEWQPSYLFIFSLARDAEEPDWCSSYPGYLVECPTSQYGDRYLSQLLPSNVFNITYNILSPQENSPRTFMCQQFIPSSPPSFLRNYLPFLYNWSWMLCLCFTQIGKQKLQHSYNFLRIHILIKTVCKQKQMSFFHWQF